MGDFGYTRREQPPTHSYEPTGIGRGFRGVGRGCGMSTAPGFARPGMPPRRDTSHLNLDPEHLKLMQRAKTYVPYLKLRRKHIFRDKRERQLADEVDDIDFCLEVILDVTAIEKMGVDTLKQAFDLAVQIANRNPLDIEAHKSELEEGDDALLGDVTTPTKTSAIPMTAGGGIQTDFNFNPYIDLQKSRSYSTSTSHFPTTAPGYTVGSDMRAPSMHHMPRPGSLHTSYRHNEFHPPRQPWASQQGRYAAPPHPATPSYSYNYEYPPDNSQGSRFFRPGFPSQYGRPPYQQRPAGPPSSFYDHSNYGNCSSYDSYSDMNSYSYAPSPQFADPRSTASYQGPAQPADAPVFRNPHSIHNASRHPTPRARPHSQNDAAGHSREYSDSYSSASSISTRGPLPEPNRYEAAGSHSPVSRQNLTNVTRDNGMISTEKNSSGPRPKTHSMNLNQRMGTLRKPDIRPYQPSTRPPKKPIKLNQPLELQQVKVPGRDSTLSTNQIPAEPRTSQAKIPEKKTVESVKNSNVAKLPPAGKHQLEGVRKISSQAKSSIVQKRNEGPAKSSKGSSQLQPNAIAEDPFDSPATISSEESSEEQQAQRTPQAQSAKKATRMKTQDKPKSKTNPVIRLPGKSRKGVKVRQEDAKTAPKKRKLSDSNKYPETTSKRQKVSNLESKSAASNKTKEKSSTVQKLQTKGAQSANKNTTTENLNKKQTGSTDKAKPSNPFARIKVGGHNSAEDPRVSSRDSVPVLRPRGKPQNDNSQSVPDQPERTARRKRVLPLPSSSDSEENENPCRSTQDQAEPSPLTEREGTAAQLVEDVTGYGYFEQIVPRLKYVTTTDHLPQIPPPPSSKGRVIGVADIFVDPSRIKIKIESDYQPIVVIKSEPVDEPSVPEDLEPTPVSESNGEDDVEKEMEAMFSEDLGSETGPVLGLTNIVLEEVDVPEDHEAFQHQADKESDPMCSISTREFNSILEPTNDDKGESMEIDNSQCNSETHPKFAFTIDQHGAQGIQAPINTLASMFVPLSSLEDGIRIKPEPLDQPDYSEDEEAATVEDQSAGSDIPVTTTIKSEKCEDEGIPIIHSVRSLQDEDKKPILNDLQDKKPILPLEEFDQKIRIKIEPLDDSGDELPSSGMSKKCPFPNCRFHGLGTVLTSHIVNQHRTSSLLIPSAVLMPEIRQILKIFSVQTGVPHLMPVEAESWGCLVCNASYPVEDIIQFYDHMTSHTGEFRVCCTICDMRFAHQEEGIVHIQEAHNEGQETDNHLLLKVTPIPSCVEKLNEVHAQICDTCGYFQLTEESMEKHYSDSKHPKENSTFALLRLLRHQLDNQGSFNSSLKPHHDSAPEQIDLCLPGDETEEFDADRASHEEILNWLTSGQQATEETEVSDAFVHYDADWSQDDPDDNEEVLLYGLVADPDDGFPVSADESRTVEDLWQEWFQNHERQFRLEHGLDEDEDESDEEMESGESEDEKAQ